jgi:hypothetical protein
MDKDFTRKIDRSLIPCWNCGKEIHDYEAKVAIVGPASDIKNGAQFVCDACYEKWRAGEFDHP